MKVVLKELIKKFPASDAVAVDHVSLDIEDGELAVLLGPSGCGKTTTMRMIAGLEQPDGGRIYLGERDITDLAPKDRRVAMVFQNFSMYPSMTVYENIAFPLRVQKLNRDEIDRQVKDAAELVGISHLLKRNSRQVSGGEAQRVALARAMVRRPEVFLMDEPLSSLDAKLRVQMRTEIRRLQQGTHSTVIFVTHDQEEAMTLGDKIVVMEQGRVQQVGTPTEVFFKPRNTFVASFVGTPSMNLIDGRVNQDGAGAICIDLDGLVQSVPDRFEATLRAQSVEQVKWGIRPESIKLLDSAELPGDIPGKVELTESLGSRQLVFVRASGKLLSVIIDALYPVRIGQPCYLRCNPAQVLLFDASTGETLAAGS